MEKHYVIRKGLNGEIEQVFEGTFEEALKLQEVWGVDEYKNYNTFDELMKKHFFGEDAHYVEVSEEDYKIAGEGTTEQKEEMFEKYDF